MNSKVDTVDRSLERWTVQRVVTQREDRMGNMRAKTRELKSTDKFERPAKWHVKSGNRANGVIKNNFKGGKGKKRQEQQEKPIFQK